MYICIYGKIIATYRPIADVTKLKNFRLGGNRGNMFSPPCVAAQENPSAPSPKTVAEMAEARMHIYTCSIVDHPIVVEDTIVDIAG